MDANHLAILSPEGGLCGQAVRYGATLLVPLHVVDPAAMTRLHLTDGRAPAAGFEIRPVCRDVRGDIAAVRPIPDLALPIGTPLTWAEDPSGIAAVDIVAIGAGPLAGGRLCVVSCAVAGLYTVSRYSYELPGRGRIDIERCEVAFLSSPVPRGWSGAAVVESGGTRLLGIIHGNAEANGGNAICLLAGRRFWRGL